MAIPGDQEHDRWRYKAGVFARLIAAIVGSYAVATAVAIAGAWSLPGDRIDAVAFGTIAGLLALPIAAMGCFWARTALRAWIGIAAFAAALVLIAAMGGWRP